MGLTMLDMIAELLGKKCRIETTDGNVAHEMIHSVGYKDIKYGMNCVVKYPVTLYYNELESEGVDLAILASITVDEPVEGTAA